MTAQEATIKLSPQSTGRQTKSVLWMEQQHSRSERGRRQWPGAACTPFQEALACRLVHPLPETTSQATVGPGMELPHSASPGKCYSSHLSRKTLFPSETPTQKIDENGAAMWKQGKK